MPFGFSYMACRKNQKALTKSCHRDSFRPETVPHMRGTGANIRQPRLFRIFP